MPPRKSLIVAAVCALVGAVLAVRVLEPQVNRLAMVLSGAVVSPDTERFVEEWWRMMTVADDAARIALLLVVVSGVPLAGLALVATYWPRLIRFLIRGRTAVWVCLTLQMTSIGFPVFVTALVATEAIDRTTATVALIAAAYIVVNLSAARVWHRLLQRMPARGLVIGTF